MNMNISHLSRSRPQYMSVRQFFAISWKHKWFIMALTAVFAVASVFIALSMPNKYKASVILAPSEEQQGGGLAALANQFSSLASLTGLNIRGKGVDNTLLAIETLKSKQFLMGFIERHQLKLPLMAAKEWDKDTGELVINPKKYDVATKTWVRKVSYPKQVEPTLFETYQDLRKKIGIKRDAKAGIVTITLEFYSPVLVQQWLTAMVAELNDYMRAQELERSKRSIDYLQKQIEQTDVAELQKVFYQLIQEQTKKAMLAEARNEYVFSTIDPAIVPEEKSAPSRALICVVLTMLGGIFSLFLVHLRHAIITARETDAEK